MTMWYGRFFHGRWLGLALALGVTAVLLPARAMGQDAATIYRQKCAICHGPDGKGNTAKGRKVKVKDLTSAEVQKLSDAQLAAAIAQGKPPNMDGFSDELSPAQIKELVALVRQLAHP